MSTQGFDNSTGTMTSATIISPGQAQFAKPRERGALEPIIALGIAVIFSIITYFVFEFTLPPKDKDGNIKTVEVTKTVEKDGKQVQVKETVVPKPSFVHQKFHFPTKKFVLAENLDFVITMSTTVLFWWVFGIALMRMLAIRWDRRYLNPEFLGYGPLDYNMMGALEQRLNEVSEEDGESIVARRARMCIEHIKGVIAAKEKPDIPLILDEAAAGDDARVANVFKIPDMLLWAIPIFGFIGTVLGIGQAIGELGKMDMSGGGSGDAMGKIMGQMAGALGTAFDTTLIALVLAVFGMVIMTFVKRSNQQLLTDIGEFVLTHFVNRLQLSSGPSSDDQMIKQLYGITQAVERQEGSTRGLMGEMNRSLKDVSETISTILARSSDQTSNIVKDAIMEAFAGFSEKLEYQLEALRESSERTNENLMTAIKGLDMNTQADNMNQSMVEAASSLSNVLASYQSDLGNSLGSVMDKQGESTHALAQATVEQTQRLTELSNQMASVVENSLLLTSMQSAMRDNLAVLNEVEEFGLTMRRMEAILDQVYHTLRAFQRPIPLKLQVHQMPPIIMDDESAYMGGANRQSEDDAVGAVAYPPPRQRQKQAGVQVVPPGGPEIRSGSGIGNRPKPPKPPVIKKQTETSMDNFAPTLISSSGISGLSGSSDAPKSGVNEPAGYEEPMNTLMGGMTDFGQNAEADATNDEPANTLMGFGGDMLAPELMGASPDSMNAGVLPDDEVITQPDEIVSDLIAPELLGAQPDATDEGSPSAAFFADVENNKVDQDANSFVEELQNLFEDDDADDGKKKQ